MAATNILTHISSHFNNTTLNVINVSLVSLNNATLYNVYIPYITHLICIYCTIYQLAYAVRSSLIHIFICTYSYSFLYTCVYKIVVVELLDYLLDINARSELEAQAFRYTSINIC